MDIIKLYQDFGIRSSDTSSKHYREGWVQTQCPFCSGNPGDHLGYHTKHNYFNCWRCGHHSLSESISRILKVNYRKANEIIKQYKGNSKDPIKTSISVKKKAFRLPKSKHFTASKYGLKYMKKRGFTEEQINLLIHIFKIRATTPISSMDLGDKKMDLKFRILAPIFYEDEMISWQTRDCTDKSNLKYITCPGIIEKMDHKKLIYFAPYKHKDFPDTLILSEGVFDVWKIYLAGYFAGCGFGVELTIDQVYWIKNTFKKVILFFDSDIAGIKKTKYLFNQLAFAGMDCFSVSAPKGEDPGSMSLEDIQNHLKPLVYKNIEPLKGE